MQYGNQREDESSCGEEKYDDAKDAEEGYKLCGTEQ